MSAFTDPDFMTRAYRARDELVEQFIAHPDVTMIDIGYASQDSDVVGNAVVRIHVSKHWLQSDPQKRVAFPTQVEGVAVIVIPGDYYPES